MKKTHSVSLVIISMTEKEEDICLRDIPAELRLNSKQRSAAEQEENRDRASNNSCLEDRHVTSGATIVLNALLPTPAWFWAQKLDL